MANVIFSTGLQSQYDGLVSKQSGTLYFITDTQRIYKGDTLISDTTKLNVVFTTSKPVAGSSSENILYVSTVDGKTTLWVKSADSMVQVGGGEATDIADGVITFSKFAPGLVVTTLGDPNDTTIPTSKAVSDAIAAAVGDIDLTPYDAAYVNVEAKAGEGTSGTILTFTTKSGSTKDVTIADLFLTAANYNSGTHILTLTVGEDQTVEVNLEELIPQSFTTQDIKLSDTIVINVPGQPGLGNFKNGTEIILDGEPTEGQIKVTDLQDFITKMASEDSNPQVTQPSASITLTGAGAKEVGTKYTPQYSANLNPGSYSDNKSGAQPTGVTATSWAVTDTNSGSADTQTGSFSEFTVEDSTNYKVNVTVSYGDGNIPTTYLGSPYPDGQIKAGSKSASSSAVTGYRNCWWGFKNEASKISDPTAITSAEIKALGNVNRNKPTTFKPTANWKQMFFAVPASQASSLSIVGTDSPLPQTVSGPVSVQVGGVDDYSPIAYNVFYVNNATESSPDTFKLTWK